MSVKKIHDEQPKDFKFSEENLKKVEKILKRYPDSSNLDGTQHYWEMP